MIALKLSTQEITTQTLNQLLEPPESLAVSIFMPTQRPGVTVMQEPLRLRNLLHKVEERLLDSHLSMTDIMQWLRPVYAYLEDPLFWSQPGEGLAIYLSSNGCYTLRLPMPCAEQVVIGRNFHIRPLLPLTSDRTNFMLLAISQNHVKLYQCTRTTIEEIALDSVPTSLAETLRYDEFERGIQMHSQGSPGPGKRAPAMVHGQGSAAESAVTKKHLQRFLQELDKGLCDRLTPEDTPLMTAGVGYIRALYRQVSHYQALLADGIEGNVDRYSQHELHQAALTGFGAYQQRERAALAHQLNELLGMGDRRALADVDHVLSAATQGRIDTLLLTKGVADWGVYDPALDLVERFDQADVEAEDLINIAAIYTLRNHGAIILMQPSEMPTGAQVAALLRY